MLFRCPGKPWKSFEQRDNKEGIMCNVEHILDKLKVSFVRDICARGALSFMVNSTLTKVQIKSIVCAECTAGLRLVTCRYIKKDIFRRGLH